MEKFTYEASWLPAASLRSTGKKNTDCSEMIISQETRPTKRDFPIKLPVTCPPPSFYLYPPRFPEFNFWEVACFVRTIISLGE